MKSSRKLFVILLFAFSILLYFHVEYYADYQTTLLPGTYIRDGSSDLTAKRWSVPVVYDWNGDGKKDLLVGHNHSDKSGDHGYVSFYKNIGTDRSPVFNGFTYIQTCSTVCSPLDVAAFG
jgi:hypothetical protein